MPVTLHIASVLRRYSGGEATVELEGGTVGEALGGLFELHPDLRSRLVAADGVLHPYLILYRNGDRLEREALASLAVESGDVLDLVGAVEGGAGAGTEPGGGAGSRDVRMRGFRERSTVEAARELAWGGRAALPAEDVAVADCAGRVLAADVASEIDVPPFRRSAMDGFALRAADTFGASLYDPVALDVVGESLPGGDAPALGAREACRIMTGAPLPTEADAVLMAEDAEEADGRVLARAAVTPGKHTGAVGEDVARGEAVLAAGRWLRPQDAGLLASIGHDPVRVHRRPRVRILVTGNELLPPGAMPRAGRIVDSNTPMLAALVERDGGELESALRVADERDSIREALAPAGCDVLLAAGGSSVGREDWLPVLVRELGELPIHGVAMRPSAPTGVGAIDGVPVFLLPGNPVSCLCAYDFFAGPAIRVLGGRDPGWPYPSERLTLTRRIASKIGRLDYVRVKRTGAGGVEPLAISGASVLSSTTRADGFAVVPAGSEGLAEGKEVVVHLYEPRGGGV